MATYEPIATYTFPSNGTAYTFSSIPQTYTDLEIHISSKSTVSLTNLQVTFNGDTGGNYSQIRGFAVNTAGTASVDFIANASAVSAGYIDTVVTAITTTINSYKQTDVFKGLLVKSTIPNPTDARISMNYGSWRNTNALNSITITDTASQFAAGGTITLYGIEAS
jgi:hypothetical protein